MKTELKKILTKEQMTKWEATKKGNLEKRKNRTEMNKGMRNQKK
jgi:hypothetical protein